NTIASATIGALSAHSDIVRALTYPTMVAGLQKMAYVKRIDYGENFMTSQGTSDLRYKIPCGEK
ncbi:hypothetical protein IWW45_006103, partial [Coemansia sp. RSA 485]